MARIFILSNRVAIPNSDRAVHPGGLEVALGALLKRNQCVWMGWSGEVREDGEELTVRREVKAGTEYIVTDLPRRDYEEYYNGFANRVLWPVLHYRQDLAEFSRRDLTGYHRVNERFAELLSQHLQPGDIVWVHDYHLMPLAQLMRSRGYENPIGFFLHIPMPPPEVVAAMPHHEKVLGSLANYDLVGFQTQADTANFARYVGQLFGSSPHIGALNGRMRIGTFPVGIEPRDIRDMALAGIAQPEAKKLIDATGNFVIGVDRLDYSKGLSLKLEAFERLLKLFPHWRGQVTLLQITPKSRSTIAEYAAMEQELHTLSGRINADYGDVLWTPMRYVTCAYPRDALATFFRLSRAGIVTPLRDGMNLVAKEYVAAQDEENPGVLVLSQFAGAAAELKAALLVNPNDTESVAVALDRALIMPLQERKDRQRDLWQALCKSDISNWGDAFIAALMQSVSSYAASRQCAAAE